MKQYITAAIPHLIAFACELVQQTGTFTNKNRRHIMKKKIVVLGAVLTLLLVVSAASAENKVYFSQQPVYIPECGHATVDILMNASDNIDTWSVMVEFDSECVNITKVNFTGSITQNNASGHHGDYIYLGGTNLTATNGNELLLATLTVECVGSGCGLVTLGFAGEDNVTRLIVGPPDGAPPYGTKYPATWGDGNAQCVGCGDVDCNGYVTGNDVVEAYKRSANPAYPLWLPWAADVDGNGYVTGNDVVELYKRSVNPAYELHCYC